MAQLNLLINQTLNIPRSSSIKDVKNLRKVLSVQIKHSQGISFSQFIQRVTRTQGVVIMRSYVCATAAVWWTQRGGKYCRLCKSLQSLQFRVKNGEMSADKFDMLFIFMFTVAGIFELIIVRGDVFPLPTHCCSHATSLKQWFYNRLVFILPRSQRVSGRVQRARWELSFPQTCSIQIWIVLINTSSWPWNHYTWQWWIATKE